MKPFVLAFVMALAGATPAFAHLDPLEHGSLAAGFTHPVFGLDHVLAMVAVGLWAATLGGRAIWFVPSAFIAAMVGGFALAIGGSALPFVEPAILASVVALGFLVALAVRPPMALGVAVVGTFGLFHGFAHSGEIGLATALDYGLGFALATATLHAVGIGLGLGIGRLNGNAGKLALRAGGALTGLTGLWLTIGA